MWLISQMNDLKIFMSDKLSSSNNRAEIYKKVRTTYIACTVCVGFLVISYTYSHKFASRFILILPIRLWNTFLPLLVNIHYLQWEPIIIVLWVLDMDQFASNIVLTESYEKNHNPGSQPQETSWTGT